MVQRIRALALVIAGGYWYWAGPYQERVNPNYQQKLRQNDEAMRDCMYRKNYAASRTMTSAGDPEETCSNELNLYQSEGRWHSYDEARQDY